MTVCTDRELSASPITKLPILAPNSIAQNIIAVPTLIFLFAFLFFYASHNQVVVLSLFTLCPLEAEGLHYMALISAVSQLIFYCLVSTNNFLGN